jgi:hypothetical protein
MEGQDSEKSYWALGLSVRLSTFVQPISEENSLVTEVRAAVQALVDLLSSRADFSHQLPGLLFDVDPHGLLVPAEVVRRMAEITTLEQLLQFAGIAGTYPIGGAAWRAIASPVMNRALQSPDINDRRSLYAAMVKGIRSWSGRPGEVPAAFVSEVEAARQARESETEPAFLPFWDWRLLVAEAELRQQEGRAKEVRGE